MKKTLSNIISYFKESWVELSKVAWPSKKRVIEITVAVLFFVIIIGFFLGAIDFGLSKVLTWLIGLKK